MRTSACGVRTAVVLLQSVLVPGSRTDQQFLACARVPTPLAAEGLSRSHSYVSPFFTEYFFENIFRYWLNSVGAYIDL